MKRHLKKIGIVSLFSSVVMAGLPGNASHPLTEPDPSAPKPQAQTQSQPVEPSPTTGPLSWWSWFFSSTPKEEDKAKTTATVSASSGDAFKDDSKTIDSLKIENWAKKHGLNPDDLMNSVMSQPSFYIPIPEKDQNIVKSLEVKVHIKAGAGLETVHMPVYAPYVYTFFIDNAQSSTQVDGLNLLRLCECYNPDTFRFVKITNAMDQTVFFEAPKNRKGEYKRIFADTVAPKTSPNQSPNQSLKNSSEDSTNKDVAKAPGTKGLETGTQDKSPKKIPTPKNNANGNAPKNIPGNTPVVNTSSHTNNPQKGPHKGKGPSRSYADVAKSSHPKEKIA